MLHFTAIVNTGAERTVAYATEDGYVRRLPSATAREIVADKALAEWARGMCVLRDPLLEVPCIMAWWRDAAGEAAGATLRFADWAQVLARHGEAAQWAATVAQAEQTTALSDGDAVEQQARLMALTYAGLAQRAARRARKGSMGAVRRS